jgi:hypothetical protein
MKFISLLLTNFFKFIDDFYKDEDSSFSLLMWEKDKQNRPLENKYNHIFNKQVA